MASGTIKQPFDLSDNQLQTVQVISSRVTLIDGGLKKYGNLVILQFKFKAIVSAANSPQIASSPSAVVDAALSCIDITSGMSTALTGSIPSGVHTSGKVYVKEIVTDHIYAVTGCYISA